MACLKKYHHLYGQRKRDGDMTDMGLKAFGFCSKSNKLMDVKYPESR